IREYALQTCDCRRQITSETAHCNIEDLDTAVAFAATASHYCHGGRSETAANPCWLALGQQITNLLEQHLLTRWRRRRRRCFLLSEALDEIDQSEQHESHDYKVDHDGDEAAPGQDRTLLLGVGQVAGGDLARQAGEVIGEVETAGERTNHRHEDVAHQRR